MNAPSEDIKDILLGILSLTLTYATDLFIGEMPKTPNNCVCIFDTGGYDPESNYVYQRPTIQVRVRGAGGGYLAAHEQAQAIRDELHGLHNETINGARYVGIWQEGDIISVGQDDNKRPNITVNFRIHRTTV